jgi:hypothetical protein
MPGAVTVFELVEMVEEVGVVDWAISDCAPTTSKPAVRHVTNFFIMFVFVMAGRTLRLPV